jgi:hypothetical protein
MKNLESTNVSTEMRAWRHVDYSPLEISGDVAAEKRATKIREQFFKEAVPCSDVIHTIPLVSFSDKQRNITMESRPYNKHTESMMQYTNMQHSNDAIVLPIIATQQPKTVDELNMSKLNEKKLSPSKSELDQLVAKTPEAQEIVPKDTSNVQKKSSNPKLSNMLKNSRKLSLHHLSLCCFKHLVPIQLIKGKDKGATQNTR